MAYVLAPGVHAAPVGDCAIILDTHADRYRKLDQRLSRALFDALTDPAPSASSDRVARLLALGVIAEAAQAALSSRAAPAASSDCVSCQGERAPLGLATVAFALASARAALKRSGLAPTLARARQRAASCGICDHQRAAAIARSFIAKRGWLPFSRACLPDSLALHALACRQGVRTDLVIGVRDHPFAAHCWVQSEGVVLTDPLEAIRALTPILWL